MKRVLTAFALLLLVLSASGCFLIIGDEWSHDIEYIARLDGGFGATMDITINNADGEAETYRNVSAGEWRTTLTVSGLDKFWAAIQADGDDWLTNSVQVEIRVDGATRKIATALSSPYIAEAAVLVD